MARELHDHFFRQAKREGYRSRAAYKLIEIDDRRSILRDGDCVLDCGAAPGSWMQVAGQRVGPRGRVIGIDLKRIDPNFNARHIAASQGDLREVAADDLLSRLDAPDARFDVVLSDMAPATTGERAIDHHQSVRLCDCVLERCADLLRPGGRLVMKVFEGEAYPDLFRRAKSQFETARGIRPKASRDESTEMFIVAEGYRGRERTPDVESSNTPTDPRDVPPPRKPSTGWSS